MLGLWGWEADTEKCFCPWWRGALMVSTGFQDNISNEQRQEIDNEGFIYFISSLYHLSLNPPASAPAPALPANTMAKPLNTGFWNGTLLSPFWPWYSGILGSFHRFLLKKLQQTWQRVSYLQLGHCPSAARGMTSGNAGPERVWSQNASVPPSTHSLDVIPTTSLCSLVSRQLQLETRIG